MAIITLPAILPTVCEWGLRSLTESYTSPLNGATQTFGKPGARWKANLSFGMLNLQQGREMQGFLVAMDGKSNRVNLINHDRPGTGANATVSGEGQVGSVINLTCTANRVFNAGDYFTVNGEFKMVTVSTQANGSGVVALPFGPMLRASPVNGATVVFTNPTCLMMLDQTEFIMQRLAGPRYGGVSIPFIEVF